MYLHKLPRANRYDATLTAVKIYNATSSPLRFESINIFVYFEKTLQPTTTLALCLYIQESVGLAPEIEARRKLLFLAVETKCVKMKMCRGVHSSALDRQRKLSTV
jgi:hypothetical protein